MAWMVPIMAAANQDGRKRRKKHKNLSIWFCILIFTCVLFPLGFLLFSISGKDFIPFLWITIFLGGIMLMVAGTVITARSTYQSDLDEVEEVVKPYRGEPRKPRYEPRGTYHWESESTRSNEIFCTNCGTQLEVEDRFCFSCGEQTNTSY
ncbi:MAG: zinc ribbon domain-containing protein [Candidatus Hodarchaeota archaeon]